MNIPNKLFINKKKENMPMSGLGRPLIQYPRKNTELTWKHIHHKKTYRGNTK